MTFRCAFSISSKSSTQRLCLATKPVTLPSLAFLYTLSAPQNSTGASLSEYSLMSKRMKGSSSASAAFSARKVLPTPGGPAKRTVARGRLRDLSVMASSSAWK